MLVVFGERGFPGFPHMTMTWWAFSAALRIPDVSLSLFKLRNLCNFRKMSCWVLSLLLLLLFLISLGLWAFQEFLRAATSEVDRWRTGGFHWLADFCPWLTQELSRVNIFKEFHVSWFNAVVVKSWPLHYYTHITRDGVARPAPRLLDEASGTNRAKMRCRLQFSSSPGLPGIGTRM